MSSLQPRLRQNTQGLESKSTGRLLETGSMWYNTDLFYATHYSLSRKRVFLPAETLVSCLDLSYRLSLLLLNKSTVQK